MHPRTGKRSGLASPFVLSLVIAALAFAARDAAAEQTQKQYRLVRTWLRTYELKLVDAPVRQPGPKEVLVRVRAVSLNRRDLYVASGHYPMRPRKSLVPVSDGAGEVVAVGPGVTRFRPGDRVAAIFYQDWLSGRSSPRFAESALGGELDGMLSQYVTLNEQGLVALPKNLTFEEGATLPCAAVTAWNGLVTRGRMKSGENVLLEGTGGVSIFGLQFATAFGAVPIVISSSDSKLRRARDLGAAGIVNYEKTSNWAETVRALTGGVGIHQVLEVGGEDTLERAIATLAPGAHVALIGGLTGFDTEIPAAKLMRINATVSGISVGSRDDFETMNRFIEQYDLKPVIDRVFEFEDAQAAYDLMESGRFFGKIVIRI